jgi:hypothetical protein
MAVGVPRMVRWSTLDRFIGEKIRELAQKINVQRRTELDDRALDEVQEENRTLDEFKNRFLPNIAEGSGAEGTGGEGPRHRNGGGGADWGTEPEAIDYSMPEAGIHAGKGVVVPLRPLLEMSVRDAKGHPVRTTMEWFTADPHVAVISADGMLEAREKGTCEVWARVRGTPIETNRIPACVWNVDHVLLTPRTLEMPLGTRASITAEVTDDDGKRSTTVLLV